MIMMGESGLSKRKPARSSYPSPTGHRPASECINWVPDSPDPIEFLHCFISLL